MNSTLADCWESIDDAAADSAVVRVAKLLECITSKVPGGRQKASGQSGDCRLSSPGGGSDRNYDWRIDATRRGWRGKVGRRIEGKKGRTGIARNERT